MKDQIARAVQVLRNGGLILYPTDTVWGIGCDATNAAAVDRIYALKRSVNKKSMIVLVGDVDSVGRYVNGAPAVAWDLLETATSPLTLILSGAANVAENLVPDEGTLGVRVPDHEFCRQLLHRFGRPLVSTSANISGEPAPVDFDGIAEEIRTGVDLVVDPRFEGKPTRKPSSIIAIDESGLFKIIR
ncbi:MAG: threonylcarbamoyl-AMP synthase [Rikenellaceae bacterium]|nr:threonylcarbamoyl-AMP synthase [Rikenellaceae bacterium]